jgi:hypothetical protein
MTSTPISAHGKDGLVTFDGQTLTITRKHLRDLLVGILRSSFRSGVRLTIEQIADVRLGKGRMVLVAPGAIRRTGKPAQAADLDYPLTVRFGKPAAAEFAALRDAVLAARPAPRPLHTPPAGYPGGRPL